MCRHALPRLAEARGSIVNISSDAGLIATSGVAVYSASKAGVNMLTKALALEFAERGVRVNAVCPTDVDTPMIEYQARTFGKGDPDAYKRALLARYPQRAGALHQAGGGGGTGLLPVLARSRADHRRLPLHRLRQHSGADLDLGSPVGFGIELDLNHAHRLTIVKSARRAQDRAAAAQGADRQRSGARLPPCQRRRKR
jgi:hypothetical protein